MLPLGWTVSTVSEYSRTASVFSSCAGSETPTCACIQAGAFAAIAGSAPLIAKATAPLPINVTNRSTRVLTPSCGLRRFKDHLLFIVRSHCLKEIPQLRIELGIE